MTPEAGEAEGPSSDHTSALQGGRPFLRGLGTGEVKSTGQVEQKGGKDRTKVKFGTVPRSGSHERNC